MEAAGIGIIIINIPTGIPLIPIIYRTYINGAYSNNFNTATITAASNSLIIITK